jgi:hypothetical protein
MPNAVIYDISQAGYSWPAMLLGLAFALAGAAGVRYPRWRRAFRVPPLLVMILGVSISLGLFLLQYTAQQRYQAALATGQYRLAEGPVEPAPAPDPAQPAFAVGGVTFGYPAGLASAASGSPLRAGARVRVYYTGSLDSADPYTILRIEAAP